ncbi:MAG TPA: hypothetical protein VGW38_05160, partial [Chloroflexota bacterium]|nr:hypothetical protein [Chloroflexota bacterium]
PYRYATKFVSPLSPGKEAEITAEQHVHQDIWRNSLTEREFNHHHRCLRYHLNCPLLDDPRGGLGRLGTKGLSE